jgi:putative flippase GtrA
LNSRVTFKTKKWTVPLFVKFAVVTLIGLWVLQFGAIYWITYIIKHTTIPEWRMFGSLSPLAQQIFPKLIAIGISFLWNFTWYSKVIFRDTSKKESIVMALDDL